MRQGLETSRNPSWRSRALLATSLLALLGGVVLSAATTGEPPAEARGRPRDVDPDALFAWALGQLIYDVPDDASGIQSAIRGHSLARTMYGLNDQVLNGQPFNGTGRLHFTHPLESGFVAGADDYRLLNYQAFDGDRLRDPERYGTRANAREPRMPFTGGANVPYTYPDLNSLSLAALRSDGTVITPSFHRDWVFGELESANPNWFSPQGKYLLLRPRPAEMGPGFPLPADPGPERRDLGDVKNLPRLPGGNDSIWIDIGAPVQTAADGRKFKPLFAFLVLDLDNLAHVNVPGNPLRGALHGSMQGWGPWEVTVSPWLWDRTRESLYAVPASDLEAPPRGPEVRFPDFRRRALTVPAFSDFRTPGGAPDDPEVDWRGFRHLSLVARGFGRSSPPPDEDAPLARLAALARVDLDRPLPPYPDEAPFVTPDELDRARAALAGRQWLAEEIYRRLQVVTGVGPIPEVAIPDPPDEALAPLRWLAQLAVNIVDYIDEDDYATPFNFYSPLLDGLPLTEVARSVETPAGEALPRYWVFGTELPSVVLNEAMVELRAPISPPGASSVKVWAELYRPAADIPSPDPLGHSNQRPAPLFVPNGARGHSSYQIVVAGPNGRTPLFDHPDNVLGSPAQVLGVAEFGPTLGTVGNPERAVPSSFGRHPYLIVGPSSDGGQDAQRTIRPTRNRPRPTRWHRTQGMEFAAATGETPASVTVVLRRLANPSLPPDPRPVAGDEVNPFYNPFITVDYVERVPVQAAGTQSTGKLQPFASHPNRVQGQIPEQGGGTRHTLGETNQPIQPAFDWLVHLDRTLISPAELFSVSGVRPHLLTQRFVTTPPGQPADFAHRVPWFDEDLTAPPPRTSHRLFRLFEYLEARDQNRGAGSRGRAPGPINVNSIHDKHAFLALVGPRLEKRFGRDTVAEIGERLLRLRSPGMVGPFPNVTERDRPFRTPGTGILPASDPQANGRGLNVDDTLFRAWDPGAPGDERRLLDVAGRDHPYLEKELLTALYNRLETRSNTFAVWLTVGYFEVHDEASQPVKLGAEVGSSTSSRVRHRFFAVLDRTNLQVFGGGSPGQPRVTRYLTRAHAQEAVPAPGEHWVPLEALSGSTATEQRDMAGAPTGRKLPWRILPGSHLFIDTGRHRELVLVTAVDPGRNAIQATFRLAHDRGFEVSLPGNPGPQPDFDPRSPLFQDVVRRAERLE